VRIRLLAIDLDGTLVNDRLEMDPRDVAAVKAAAAAGVTVVLATGRMFKSSLRYAQPLGLTGPIINYQGAVVREIASGDVWYRCELTVPMQQRVLALLHGARSARGGSLRPDRHGAVRSGRPALEVGETGLDQDGPGRPRSRERPGTDGGVERLDG
jgi:hypothetical protein